MKQAQVKELLLQSLQHERGGIKVYQTALQCVVDDGLQQEFQRYLEQTQNHERILLALLRKLKLDPEEPSPGRVVVRMLGESLVSAMQTALQAGNPQAAQLVAC